MKIIQPNINLNKKKIAIVAANFYKDISNNLINSAHKTLIKNNINDNNISLMYVAGAFEIPFICKQIAKYFDGIITLGAVIRGDTPHFDYICSSCASGITQVALSSNTPIVFGVLTTENKDQAVYRSSANNKNKGIEAATALLKTLSLLQNYE